MFVFLNESLLLEATSPYIQKVFDPALLTFKEYAAAINPRDMWHPDSAYQYSLSENDLESTRYEIYNTLINRVKKNGLIFELRMKTKPVLYGKQNEDGEYIRDEKGSIILLTDEEKKELGLNSVRHSFAIFNDQKKAIGVAQFEFGATLISVVKEYKGWGFAKILMDIWEKTYPGNDSGGFTSEGFAFTRKYHAEKVREYLASGFYSFLIRSGQISKEKVKEILSELPEKSKKKKIEYDLDFNKPEDLLLMRYADTDYILYNKKAYDFYQTDLEEKFDFLKDRIIKAHFRVFYYDHGSDVLSRIQFFEYDNEDYKNIMQSALMYEVVKHDLDLKQDEVYKKAFDGINKNKLIVDKIPQMINKEKSYRRKNDEYQEIEDRIVEMAYSKYDNN